MSTAEETAAVQSLLAQVIANMSPEIKELYLDLPEKDQVGLATELAIDCLRANQKIQVLFQTSPEFKASLESMVLEMIS
jgi:nitrate/nitrite-specific signal transduction histidine kinase